MQGKKFFIGIIFIFLSLIILIKPGSAIVDIGQCQACHSIVKPLEIPITKDCMACHHNHGGAEPTTRVQDEVHRIHLTVDEGKLNFCKTCHTSPVNCNKCHKEHEVNNISIKINYSAINAILKAPITNYTYCQGCHGALPTPYGHIEFRDALKKSKHNWMNCGTCHLPPFKNSNDVQMHFKDLMITNINTSINLCKICHSPEFKGLKEGTHGTANNTCIDCHNPHATSTGNTKLVIPTQTSAPINFSGTIDGATNYLTSKFPILNNSVAVAVIFILIAVTASEYLLSKKEEGQKVGYKMVRVQADENTFKTLEVKLENQNINLVNDILKENNIDIIGMTMTKGHNLYDYVIFVNIKQILDEIEGTELIEKITDRISLIREVKSVEVTDKYEL